MSKSSTESTRSKPKPDAETVVLDTAQMEAIDTTPDRDESSNAESTSLAGIESSNREDLIRQAAYRRFKERGTPHGDEVQDWLEAEAEINQSLVE